MNDYHNGDNLGLEPTTPPCSAPAEAIMADRELLPCPFCGSGKTEIREDRPWLGMRYGEPSSVSVRHWCEPIEGQPSRMIERVGRDRAAAIAAWNMRTTAQEGKQ